MVHTRILFCTEQLIEDTWEWKLYKGEKDRVSGKQLTNWFQFVQQQQQQHMIVLFNNSIM